MEAWGSPGGTPHRIAIGKIDIDDADVPDDYLQEPRMTVGIVSDERFSNRLHRMSRQNRNPVIGFLRDRYTLIAERLEGFGREFRPLQFLQQLHIRFAGFQPCRDMGQPRADRIQVPASDSNHQSTF